MVPPSESGLVIENPPVWAVFPLLLEGSPYSNRFRLLPPNYNNDFSYKSIVLSIFLF